MLLTFDPQNHFNKFGYYSVGGVHTYSKYEALQMSAALQTPVRFIYNDDVFANYDWTQQPSQTLSDLYRERAQSLREKYDYIVLLYSGGADSYNMLMSFVNNGIPVDEILHIVELGGDNDPNSFANAEITRVAVPHTQQIIKDFNLQTRQRVIDLSDIILRLPSLVSDEEYKHFLTRHWSPINMARSFIRETTPEYQDIISAGKSMCLLWGTDKPLVTGLWDKVTGEYYYGLVFSDRMDGQVTTRQKYLQRSWEHDEFFYWSPDSCDLMCKQGHLLMETCKSLDHSQQHWHVLDRPRNPNQSRELGSRVFGSQRHWLTLAKGHSVIYPCWNPATFTTGKTRSDVFSDKDAWVFRNHLDSGVVSLFRSVLDSVNQLPGWLNPREGIATSYSRIYPLQSLPSRDPVRYDIDVPTTSLHSLTI